MSIHAGWARAVSLVVGLTLGMLFLVYPHVAGTRMTPMLHAALPLVFAGVSAALVHGFGLRPHNRALRVFFSPAVAWPLIAFGAALLVVA